jgi:hypothetical protein
VSGGTGYEPGKGLKDRLPPRNNGDQEQPTTGILAGSVSTVIQTVVFGRNDDGAICVAPENNF